MIGRLSRALPLYFSEQVYLRNDARTHCYIPWIANHGGFLLTPKSPDDQAVAAQMRRLKEPNDYAVVSHLLIVGHNWRLENRIVRTVDAKCLASFAYDFVKGRVQPIMEQAMADILGTLREETGMLDVRPPYLGELAPDQIDHYLFRTEQTLAARCSSLDGIGNQFLSHICEMVDGVLDLCLRNPGHFPCRLLLLEILKSLKPNNPELIASYQAKVKALQKDVPTNYPFEPMLNETLDDLFHV